MKEILYKIIHKSNKYMVDFVECLGSCHSSISIWYVIVIYLGLLRFSDLHLLDRFDFTEQQETLTSFVRSEA